MSEEKMSEEGKTLDDFGFDEYTKQQMVLIAEDLNAMQMKYDTRLLAALMAGRSGLLHGVMIKGEVMTQEEARVIWKQAGVPIENPPDQEVKIMRKLDDDVFDPETTN